MSAPTKPVFKATEKPPMKPPPEVLSSVPKVGALMWQPIATAPQDEAARFVVRATVLAKDGKARQPVAGTDTIVRYRASRKMVGRKWERALTMIDDKLGTKLGFRPDEWKALDA